ncbi:signal peptidase II [candidate division GN15 bacterium]|nr:signal peptidase II [candidate division GN15 bacterium]
MRPNRAGWSIISTWPSNGSRTALTACVIPAARRSPRPACRRCRTPACVSRASPPRRRKKLAAEKRTSLLWPVLIVLVVVALDQATKIWAVHALADQPPVRVLGDFLMFTLVYNRGGAMGTSLGSPMYYLVVALIILPFIIYYIIHHRHEAPLSWSLSFIAGGAIGNVIDRIRLGQVVDFIDVDFFDINLFGYQLRRWWTFNIADAAIFCAMIFLVIYLLWYKPRSAAHGQNADEEPPAQTDS